MKPNCHSLKWKIKKFVSKLKTKKENWSTRGMNFSKNLRKSWLSRIEKCNRCPKSKKKKLSSWSKQLTSWVSKRWNKRRLIRSMKKSKKPNNTWQQNNNFKKGSESRARFQTVINLKKVKRMQSWWDKYKRLERWKTPTFFHLKTGAWTKPHRHMLIPSPPSRSKLLK